MSLLMPNKLKTWPVTSTANQLNDRFSMPFGRERRIILSLIHI